MKKTGFGLLLCLMMLLFAGRALSEEKTYAYRIGWGVERKATVVPMTQGALQDVADTLIAWGFGGDAVLDGVCMRRSSTHENMDFSDQRFYLLSIRHQDKRVLFWIGQDEVNGRWATWTAMPISDLFLQEGETVRLDVLPIVDCQTGKITNVYPAVCYGQETFFVSQDRLRHYQRSDGQGTMDIEFMEDGTVKAAYWVNGEMRREYTARVLWPWSLEFMRLRDVPTSFEALADFAKAHPFPENTDYAVVRGGNFRREATGSSASQGIFHIAPAHILGEKPGLDGPWYHIKMGGMEGWISFAYVDQGQDSLNLWIQVQAVGVVQRETALLDGPRGTAIKTLHPGQMAHVLMKKDGYLYILIPQGEIGWTFDENGAYGWVPEKEIEAYPSPLQARLGGVNKEKLFSGE